MLCKIKIKLRLRFILFCMTTAAPVFDLEKRSIAFALNVRDFLNIVHKTPANKIYTSQLLRSSSSIGANYIEANDSLGRKDFVSKVKTSRREARETCYWLQLLALQKVQQLEQKQKLLIDEATQLVRILSAIIQKVPVSE